MISEIAIKNLAIIDDIRISFNKGLNILTGETGAGKSIIINAINLILGDRANAKMIRTGEETAEIEAGFVIEKESPAWKKMKENDFDPEEGLIIRRIIAKNNRHKIYINQRLATASVLNAITRNLASVSGQHEHQSLLDEKNNIFFIDSFGGLNSLREEVSSFYNKKLELEETIKSLKSKKSKLEKDSELIAFQKNEIEMAQLNDENEDIKLEQELKKLKNAKKLIETAHKTSEVLYSGTNSVSELISGLRKELESAALIDDNFSPFLNQIESVYAEVEDLGLSVSGYADEIETDEEKLNSVYERIELINKLKQKYGNTINDILDFYEKIENHSSDFESTENKLIEKEKELEDTKKEFFYLAEKLSTKRKKASKELEKIITKSVRELEMPHADFIARIKSDPSFINETGIDKAELLISPNPGEEAKPISETASGGELSRLVLAIKSATAETGNVSTIIFDEADAGIGGQAAEKTGRKIKSLSLKNQIICITHLTQIAKFADHHFYIQKNVVNNRTVTSIKTLDKNERINEIARMISGDKITQKSFENARELIEQSA
ncbi:MAG: DNA repair protein RecN [Thermodesulfobacteriota bacterium]